MDHLLSHVPLYKHNGRVNRATFRPESQRSERGPRSVASAPASTFLGGVGMEALMLLLPIAYIATIVFLILLFYRLTTAVERIADHLERKG